METELGQRARRDGNWGGNRGNDGQGSRNGEQEDWQPGDPEHELNVG